MKSDFMVFHLAQIMYVKPNIVAENGTNICVVNGKVEKIYLLILD